MEVIKGAELNGKVPVRIGLRGSRHPIPPQRRSASGLSEKVLFLDVFISLPEWMGLCSVLLRRYVTKWDSAAHQSKANNEAWWVERKVCSIWHAG